MVLLFVRVEEKWEARRLEGVLELGSTGDSRVCLCPGADGYMLLAAPEAHAWLNGRAVMPGVPVQLLDRDEIRLGRERFYYSTEQLARVEPFPGGDRPMYCPRCRQAIEAGEAAVRCPNPQCGCWHHSSDELPCWSYAATCALCPQPTETGGAYQWTPEEI